jgi:hypothetical protein
MDRHQWLSHVILATQEAEIGGSWFKARPYLKNTQHKKRVSRVVQVVECLPNKGESRFRASPGK